MYVNLFFHGICVVTANVLRLRTHMIYNACMHLLSIIWHVTMVTGDWPVLKYCNYLYQCGPLLDVIYFTSVVGISCDYVAGVPQ